MTKFEAFMLKKRKWWVHLILAYFTGFIWLVLYFIARCSYKNKKPADPVPAKPRTSSVIYNDFIKVVGVSFHDAELKKVIGYLVANNLIEKFDGLSNKEIIESGDDYLSIYENQFNNNVRLVQASFENKPAIEVHIDCGVDDLMIGFVPSNLVPLVSDYLNDPELKCGLSYEVIGGLTKNVVIDDETDKEKIEQVELDFGIRLHLIVTKKRA